MENCFVFALLCFHPVKMNIPAYASPRLCIDRSYDSQTSEACIDIYPKENMVIEDTKVNQFSFKYRVIKNSKDTKNLLNIPGELSLKVKAGIVSVSGSGKYLRDNKKTEDMTEVLAVLRCLTVCFAARLGMISHYIACIQLWFKTR